MSQPDWLSAAEKKCLCDEERSALDKGSQIAKLIEEEPVVFVHRDSCEFKWPGKVMYTFPDDKKPTFFIIQNGEAFVSADREQFISH